MKRTVSLQTKIKKKQGKEKVFKKLLQQNCLF